MENNETGKKNKRGLKVYIPLILVIATVVAAGIYWYGEYTRYIRTDDAYIDTDNISVSSRMMSRIVQVYADEGDTVQAGELLARLDTGDIIAQRNHAIALKNQAESSLRQTEAQYRFNRESLKVLEINLDKAKNDLDRARAQFEGGVIPEEQFEHIRMEFESTGARLDAARSQLKVSGAQIESARSAVHAAASQIGVIDTQLKNTLLYAPITGIVAKRWLMKGDVVQPGQSVFTVTNNQKLWVMVYLEETKIADVHLKQKSLFTVDAYSGVTFTGEVFSIGSNTASQFSLIPPNNASGNFTKVTQRVPVKISIDCPGNSTKFSALDLLAGMSVIVKIVRD